MGRGKSRLATSQAGARASDSEGAGRKSICDVAGEGALRGLGPPKRRDVQVVLTPAQRSGIHLRVEKELDIASMAPSGEGVGRDGERSVFVPLSVPGDRVRALVTTENNRLRGELLEILSPASARIDPPCPIVGVCGGCDWQQVEYPTQLTLKEDFVRDALARVGLDPGLVRPIVRSPAPFRYRRRVRARLVGKGWGFSRKGTNKADRAPGCLLVEERVEAFADLVAPLLKTASVGGLQGFALDTLESGVAALHVEHGEKPTRQMAGRLERVLGQIPGLQGIVLTGSAGKPIQLGDPTLVDANHFGLRVRPELFAQANRLGIRLLAAHVAAQVPEGARVLELFAGAGTLTLAYEGRAGELVVSEGEGPSLDLLRLSLAERNRAARFEPGASATVARRLQSERFDHLVLDPPRAGAKEAVEPIAALGAQSVSWVSCDAVSFAKDARRMVEGGYALVDVVPFDLFPQTHHVELVASFVRA